jgi:nucleoside-diphosphate-sugar epimerase
MRGVDAVIHLGAIVGDPACELDSELTIEINLMATRMIAEVAKGSGVQRFLFASTCSVYGVSDDILDEHSNLNPVSLYAKSKIASEKVLMAMADHSFAPTILRFGTIYGLSGRTRFDLVVNLLAAKAVIDQKITICGGEQWRPFLHVDDAALGVLKTLDAPLSLVGQNVFNVGSDEQNYTIEQVGELVRSIVPGSEIVNLGADRDARDYRVSFKKIRQSLDFSPRWELEQGITQVVNVVMSGGVRDYRDPIHSNVRFLNEHGIVSLIPQGSHWAHELINEASAAKPVAKKIARA